MTRWAKDVSPENVWQEYPRPQMTPSRMVEPEWVVGLLDNRKNGKDKA